MTEETLFELAIQSPQTERASILDRECAGNPDLRLRVEALLRAHELDLAGIKTGTYSNPNLTRTNAADSVTAHFPNKDEHAGAVIAGKYTLVEVIGEGGMGSVWRAKQTEPVKRFVAI